MQNTFAHLVESLAVVSNLYLDQQSTRKNYFHCLNEIIHFDLVSFPDEALFKTAIVRMLHRVYEYDRHAFDISLVIVSNCRFLCPITISNALSRKYRRINESIDEMIYSWLY